MSQALAVDEKRTERPSSAGGGLHKRLHSTASFRDDWDCKVCPDITLNIVVLGASGDLAKKKTFPALFALYRQG